MKDFFDAAWKICVLVFLMLILVAITSNAESAIVSFDNAEHLAALKDSVVGICDTVFSYIVDADSLIAVSAWQITCRELVCVTVVPEPCGPITQTTGAIIDTRQKAIIAWRKVKR